MIICQVPRTIVAWVALISWGPEEFDWGDSASQRKCGDGTSAETIVGIPEFRGGDEIERDLIQVDPTTKRPYADVYSIYHAVN